MRGARSETSQTKRNEMPRLFCYVPSFFVFVLFRALVSFFSGVFPILISLFFIYVISSLGSERCRDKHVRAQGYRRRTLVRGCGCARACVPPLPPPPLPFHRFVVVFAVELVRFAQGFFLLTWEESTNRGGPGRERGSGRVAPEIFSPVAPPPSPYKANKHSSSVVR